MQKSDDLRKNAENCAEKAQIATTPHDRARFKRMEKAWENLANKQAWLEGGQEGRPRSDVNSGPALVCFMKSPDCWVS